MLSYKIFLNEDMSLKRVVAPFNLIQYSWQDTLLNVYIPKSIVEATQNISNAVSITFSQVDRNGNIVNMNDNHLYLFDFVKDNIIVEATEYVLYTRLMPKQMTLFSGEHQKLQINLLTYVDNVLNSVSTSNLIEYVVFPSVNVETGEEKTDLSEISAEVNSLKSRVAEVENGKQDKVDNQIQVHTSSAVSEERETTSVVNIALNKLDERLDSQEEINQTQQEDIDTLKATVTSQFVPLGKLNGTTQEPTLAQINTWLQAQGITAKLGDLITYVGHIVGGVDSNYNCLYTKNGWIWYETTSLEVASNTEMGVVKGSADTTRNVAVNISNGDITDIKVKDTDGVQQSLKSYMNSNQSKIDNVLSGDTVVPKAEKATKDSNGNTIVSTYQTIDAGATKQYVKDYAMAKVFNDVYFLNVEASQSGYAVGTMDQSLTSNSVEVNTSALGDNLVARLTLTNTRYTYQLSKNNMFGAELFLSVDSAGTYKVKTELKHYHNGVAKTLATTQTDDMVFQADTIKKINIESPMLALDNEVIDVAENDLLVLDVYIFNDNANLTKTTIYSTTTRPSSFNLSISYQTITIISGGAIGQQYIHTNATYDSQHNKIIFDIDTELNNGTVHCFMANVTFPTGIYAIQNALIVAKKGNVQTNIYYGNNAPLKYEGGDGTNNKYCYFVNDTTTKVWFQALYTTNNGFNVIDVNLDGLNTRINTAESEIADIMRGNVPVPYANNLRTPVYPPQDISAQALITLKNNAITTQNFLNKIYPVGSIYMSVNSTSPATLFGGTWEQIQDRFLLAAGQTYAAGDTGGEASHNHSLNNAGAKIGFGGTAEDGYSVLSYKNNADALHFDANTMLLGNPGYADESKDIRGITATKLVGNTDDASNMPPYLAVYMWKRTA